MASSGDIPIWLSLVTGLGLGSLAGTAATLCVGIIRDNRQHAHDLALRNIDAAREKEHWRRTEARIAYTTYIGHVDELIETIRSLTTSFEYVDDEHQTEREAKEVELLNKAFDQTSTILDHVYSAAIQVRLVGSEEACNVSAALASSFKAILQHWKERGRLTPADLDIPNTLVPRFLTIARTEFVATPSTDSR